MTPRIITSREKKLIGKHMSMSFTDYKVGELWKSFMPHRKEMNNAIGNDLISMTIYPAGYYKNFNPSNQFEKWAAIEVTGFDHIPANMETHVLPAGLYTVFDYKGSNTDNAIYHYIFNTWLPASCYVLDERPHFEVLGEKYKNNDPSSEEEIWIPVRLK